MFIRFVPTLLLFCALVPLSAQEPFITNESVVNAASLNRGLQNPRLAPGSLASIFGQNLGHDARVTFDGHPAPILFASPGQINLQVPVAILPPGTSGTRVAVVVQTPRGQSQSALIEVAATGVGIFTQDASGTGPGVIVNINADGSTALHSKDSPAGPGGYLTIYATGLGDTAPSVPDAELAPFAPLPRALAQLIVAVDGRMANVLYAGRAPGFIGLDQINVQLPADTPESCSSSLVIATPTSISQSVPIYIRNSGTCN